MTGFPKAVAAISAIAGVAAAIVMAWTIVVVGRVPVAAALFVSLVVGFVAAVLFFGFVQWVAVRVELVRKALGILKKRGYDSQSPRKSPFD